MRKLFAASKKSKKSKKPLRTPKPDNYYGQMDHLKPMDKAGTSKQYNIKTDKSKPERKTKTENELEV